MNILGISAFYHDSAACLLSNGEIVAACQEERLSRIKHDESFPVRSVHYCLHQGRLGILDVDYIVFYEKPLTKFDRIIESFLYSAPNGGEPFRRAMPVWLRSRLRTEKEIRKELDFEGDILFVDHHAAHSASAFFPSPFKEATVLTMDGVGEWTTIGVAHGHVNRIEPLWEQRFPHSLGLLYSAFTAFLGFGVNSGEHKMMGLSSYGEPVYRDLILENLLDLKEDGSFRLNMDYFDILSGRSMTNERFHDLFQQSPRIPESPITNKDRDIASSIQWVTEEVVLRVSQFAMNQTGSLNLCMGGGVSLNCVANGRLLREGPFENIWIQPASGDAGGALGAALLVWHRYLENGRVTDDLMDSMSGSFLGPAYDDEEISRALEMVGIPFTKLPEGTERYLPVADLLAEGLVVGWFQGRMEFGPRALGARSILADPRRMEIKDRINETIKFRETFRPFAPVILEESAKEYFALEAISPYMLLAAPVKRPDEIPAATHVDGSARVQTVSEEMNPDLHSLISLFSAKTGCPVMLNTSFNVRGEPVVCSPEDAILTFMSTGLDILVMGSFLVAKKDVEGVIVDLDALEGEELQGHQKTGRLKALSTALTFSMPFVILAVAGLFRNWSRAISFSLALIPVAGVVVSLLRPEAFGPANRIVSRFARWVARLQTKFILGTAYFLVITPVGFFMRMSGWDPFLLRKKDMLETFWLKARSEPDKENYHHLS